ncbi:MAG TPA: hypothetical protein V6C76_07985 [Drouetiella sp.]
MAIYKIRVLSAALCAFTLSLQLKAVAADIVTEPVSGGADTTAVASDTTASAESKELKGGVSKTEVAPEELIDQLVQNAFDRDERADEITKKEGKYNGAFRRSVARVSDMAQFMTAYKGFQASSEAADVILAEKEKLKSRAAVDWIKQKHHDELHPKVVSSLMQIASGLGMTDPARQQKNVDLGVKQLASIVGDEDAKRALTAMTAWAASVKDTAPASTSQEPLSVLQMDAATKKVIENSLQRDGVVLETKAKLHKYNHRSKLMMATAKVVNTTLSVAMFSPTFVSPAAQLTLLAFLASTGGPEEAKLLKELYLDRRIESRYKMINQEVTQAVSNYNVASITGNTVLGQFCNLTAGKMGGKDVLVVSVTAPDTIPGVNVTTSDASTDDSNAKMTDAKSADTAVSESSQPESKVSETKTSDVKDAKVSDAKGTVETKATTETKVTAESKAVEEKSVTLSTTSSTPATDILRASGALSKNSADATDNSAAESSEVKSSKKSGDVGMTQPGTSL